jgi:hypothetical protein
MTPSLKVLLDGVVDYAGLFPPAKLDMAASVRNYSAYMRGTHSWVLGRFIVPVSRLEEFNFHLGDIHPRSSGELWRVSALADSDFAADLERIKSFNRWHGERDEGLKVAIDSVEVKANSAGYISEIRRMEPGSLRVFFELPAGPDCAELVWSIAQAGGSAKLRAGSVTGDTFPSIETVVGFIYNCLHAGIRFKATAGLHHPIRGVQPLTYEPDSERGMMYGFLNVLLCAAFAYDGMREDDAASVLAEESVGEFVFDDSGVAWHGHHLAIETISLARRDFVVSFGSCSFEEPLNDLRKFRLL